MQLVFAVATLLASVGATYFFCVRPMRQGRHCVMMPEAKTSASRWTGRTAAEELDAMRAEVKALRTTMDIRDDSPLGSAPPSRVQTHLTTHPEPGADLGAS